MKLNSWSAVPEIRLRRLREDAKLPTRAHPGDAGLDLYLLENVEILPQQGATVRTGVSVAIPEGFVGIISDRSSMAKKGVKIAGGIIDSGYRGEIHVVLWNLATSPMALQAGDRVAQLMVVAIVVPQPIEVTEFESTSRGDKGFGSSGR